jgi:deoxyribonuclease (pyrimidine dimer)
MRINIVPPSELMDQHLMAEIREIKMLPKSLVRSLNSKKGVDFNSLPTKYTMGTGHGKFFYDKLLFIIKRFFKLLEEADKRNFKLQESTKSLFDIDYEYSPYLLDARLFNDYTPSDEDLEVNRSRIRDRLNEKPEFYKYYGLVPVNVHTNK